MCIPISITPIVVKNQYKQTGATSRINVIIPEYNYAVILKPTEGTREDGQSTDKESIPEKQTEQVVYRSVNSEVKQLKNNSEKLLNKVRYQDIEEELHLGQREKEISLKWFKEHKGDKPMSSYVVTMGLAQWQIDILEAMINRNN